MIITYGRDISKKLREILDKDEYTDLDTIIGQITALINENYVLKKPICPICQSNIKLK